MSEHLPTRFYALVALTLIVALLVAVIPFPLQYQILRPELLCLTVIYWMLSAPQHFGLIFAFASGLMLDLLEFSVWGVHAFSLSVVAYICHNAHARMRHYSIWMQSFWVGIFVGCHQVVGNWFFGLAGYNTSTANIVISTLSTTVLWPIFSLLLMHVRIRMHIYA